MSDSAELIRQRHRLYMQAHPERRCWKCAKDLNRHTVAEFQHCEFLLATSGEETMVMNRPDNDVSDAATDKRYSILIAAAQSALGFMEGIVHENLASQKFVKDSARQQIQQLRDALYAAYRCGYCNDKIVRATVGGGYVHVKSGLRACIEQRVDDPSSPNATPER